MLRTILATHVSNSLASAPNPSSPCGELALLLIQWVPRAAQRNSHSFPCEPLPSRCQLSLELRQSPRLPSKKTPPHKETQPTPHGPSSDHLVCRCHLCVLRLALTWFPWLFHSMVPMKSQYFSDFMMSTLYTNTEPWVGAQQNLGLNSQLPFPGHVAPGEPLCCSGSPF